MPINEIEFVCALSGIPAKEEEMEEGYPEGWVTIILNRRFISPKWDAIQYVKQALVQQALEGMPTEQREEQVMNVMIQVEAQFALLESQTPQHSDDEKTLYISNPDDNPQIMEAYNDLRKMLGLKPEEVYEEEEDQALETITLSSIVPVPSPIENEETQVAQ